MQIYLADAAIALAVMLRDRALPEDPAALGVVTETAVFKHQSNRMNAVIIERERLSFHPFLDAKRERVPRQGGRGRHPSSAKRRKLS